MRSASQAAIFLKNLAVGILAPVLVLGLLAHGATISTVSLLLGVYSLTVILAEFPSGAFRGCVRQEIRLPAVPRAAVFGLRGAAFFPLPALAVLRDGFKRPGPCLFFGQH